MRPTAAVAPVPSPRAPLKLADARPPACPLVVMSLETARQDIINTKDDCFTVAFVDEVHKVKNPKAQLTKALKQLGPSRLLRAIPAPCAMTGD